MSSEPDSEPHKRRARETRSFWGFIGIIAGVVTTLVGIVTIGSCLGIPSYGELQTKALAAEHERVSAEVHRSLDARVTVIEEGLGDKLKSFETLLKERLPKKR